MQVHAPQLGAQGAGIELRDVEQRLEQLVDRAQRLVELMKQRCRLAPATALAQCAGKDAGHVQWLQEVVARRRQEARLADTRRLRLALRIRKLLVEQCELASAL